MVCDEDRTGRSSHVIVCADALRHSSRAVKDDRGRRVCCTRTRVLLRRVLKTAAANASQNLRFIGYRQPPIASDGCRWLTYFGPLSSAIATFSLIFSYFLRRVGRPRCLSMTAKCPSFAQKTPSSQVENPSDGCVGCAGATTAQKHEDVWQNGAQESVARATTHRAAAEEAEESVVQPAISHQHDTTFGEHVASGNGCKGCRWVL